MEYDLASITDNYIICTVCSNKSLHKIDYPTNTILGYPDLDTRPSDTGRSIIYKVQRCPYCGYCAENISHQLNFSKQIINSDKYILQLNNKYFPVMCNSFLCKSMIDFSNQNYIECAWTYIYAAWACDDFKNDSGSIFCRKLAIGIIKKLEKDNKLLTEKLDDHIALKIDLMRRGALFEEALKLIQKYVAEIQNDVMIKILRFQENLIKNLDIGCYTFEDATKRESIKDRYMPAYNKYAKQKIYKNTKKVVIMNIIFNDLVANLFKELNRLSSIPEEQKNLTLYDYKELVNGSEKILKMIKISLDIDKTQNSNPFQIDNSPIDIGVNHSDDLS